MTTNGFAFYRRRCRDFIFAHILAYLRSRTAALPPGLRRCVEDYPRRRGKAFRPVLATLVCEAYGGSRAAALKVAAAYQLLEDWGLGRDDILDGAVLRRGRPSLPRLYGLPRAVNALDLLHVYVVDMLYSYCGLSPRRYADVHALFVDATAVTLTGQYLDVEARDAPLESFTEKDYFKIAETKTAFYTGVVPCLLGSALAGAKAPSADLRRFGLKLGTAFQIMDDVLDMENDGTGRFGKIPGNDLSEGKRTLVALRALRRLGPRGRSRLSEFYALPPARRTPDRTAGIRRLILESGAAAECRAEVRALTRDALAVLEEDLMPGMRRPYGGWMREFVLEWAERAA